MLRPGAATGDQQRVAIARALVNQPGVVLADEPTGAMDSRIGSDVVRLTGELHQEGITVVLVTHDSAFAERRQRLARNEDGRIASGRERGGQGLLSRECRSFRSRAHQMWCGGRRAWRGRVSFLQ